MHKSQHFATFFKDFFGCFFNVLYILVPVWTIFDALGCFGGVLGRFGKVLCVLGFFFYFFYQKVFLVKMCVLVKMCFLVKTCFW